MALTHILEPIRINKLEVKNRIARAAHGTSYGKGGITEDLIAYHEARAKAGLGLNILEATVVHPSSYTHTVAAWDDSIIPGFTALGDAHHKHGARMFVQLWHGGHRWAPADGRAPLSASTVPCPLGAVNTPFAMTHDQIEEITEAFVATALRVQAAGLDGVELHAGHGYLLHQFLCPLTNKRDDEYGGSLENRMRLTRDILIALRKAAGPDFPIGIRISDYNVPGGFTFEEAGEVVARLCTEGHVDYVSASMGSPYSIASMLGAMDMPVGYMLSSAGPIAARATVPTMIAGRYRTLEEGDQAIREGSADMVSFVRGMIAEPDLIAKTVAGKADRVRPCIACNQGCVAGIRTSLQRMLCTVNPAVGFEATLSEDLIKPAKSPRKVVIVGGGPAGLEAARLAALSGHKVVLLEAQAALGGAIQIARQAPKLQTIGDIIYWLEQEIYTLGVDVRLSTYVEAEDVLAEKPDVVIIATGSLPRMDGFQVQRPERPVPGFDRGHVLSSHDVFQRPRDTLGKSAVVLDDVGHYEAIAVAEHLITQGLKVTFVTRHSSFAPHIEAMVRSDPALGRLRQGDFTLHVRARLVSIGADACEVGYIDGEQVWREPADTVVLVTYNEPQTDLYRALGGGLRQKPAYALHLIGDAQAPRDLLIAIREGHLAGRIREDA
ncbi:oxidoreductase [Terricaulis silvestris]|uniref:NADH oxidase n=1 Tax=Terricaulis silvestris TaxID=2686094 RepID=A0A6I6MQD9_9CAUL|nr:FAD-dependent oxidoreductase [Terricaulis silvestris]QGZ93762.1 NADH oxidase [Terricaulis silvestris]